jgi:hypothetical protein
MLIRLSSVTTLAQFFYRFSKLFAALLDGLIYPTPVFLLSPSLLLFLPLLTPKLCLPLFLFHHFHEHFRRVSIDFTTLGMSVVSVRSLLS